MPVSNKVTAILEEVRALPSTDREVFARLFHVLDAAGEAKPEPAADETKSVQWPDFAGRMKATFGERVLPGDPQEFWDEERGR